MSRKFGPKKRDGSPADLTMEEIATFEEYPDVVRPKVRGDCWDFESWKPIGTRPCPFVSCRYNNYLRVTRIGTILLDHDVPPEEIKPDLSCALDIEAKHMNVDRDGPTTDEIAEALGIGRNEFYKVLEKTQERARIVRSKLLKVLNE